MSESKDIDEITIKEEPIDSEDVQQCVKSDPDQDYLLISSPQQHQNNHKRIKKEENETKITNKSVECKVCNKELSAVSLRRHIRSIHPEEYKKECNFHCDLCGLLYKYKIYLINHIEVVHIKEKEQFQCDFDGRMFKNKQKLHNHMRIHLSNVKCKICDKEMKARSLWSHVRDVHSTNSSKFQCHHCLKNFKTKIYLQSHMKTHDKKFQCKICDKKFGLKIQLKSHMTIHDDSLKFECKICDQKFKQKHYMQKHLKIQHGNLSKSFKCLQCIYATYSIHLLRIHSKIHDKTRPKPFKCSKCDYATDVKASLSKHMKTHEEIRVKHHKCNRCDFATDHPHHLIRHMKSHEKHDEKVKSWKNPIKCEKCWMFSKDKTALYNHMKSVHVDAKFQCNFCGKLFKVKHHIPTHFRNFHKIEI